MLPLSEFLASAFSLTTCFYIHIQARFADKGTTYLFNNIKLILFYHKATGPLLTDGRIVRAEVELDSCQDSNCSVPMVIDSPALRMRLKRRNEVLHVPYTYSVIFEEAEHIVWESRWNYILNSKPQSNVIWFSTIFSIVIMITPLTILWHLLRLDFNKYMYKKDSVSNQIQFLPVLLGLAVSCV